MKVKSGWKEKKVQEEEVGDQRECWQRGGAEGWEGSCVNSQSAATFKWWRWETNGGTKNWIKCGRPRYGGRERRGMEGRVRRDKRCWRLQGLIIERVEGRGEPCWSDRSAELKPSSGLLCCPADVKVSAPEGEQRDAWRMLTAQGCLWNGQRVTASSTSFLRVNIYDNHKGMSSVISTSHLSLRRI